MTCALVTNAASYCAQLSALENDHAHVVHMQLLILLQDL